MKKFFTKLIWLLILCVGLFALGIFVLPTICSQIGENYFCTNIITPLQELQISQDIQDKKDEITNIGKQNEIRYNTEIQVYPTTQPVGTENYARIED